MLLVRHPAVLLSRFLIKAPEGPPRKDKNLPNVIINEKRNTHAAAHQGQVFPHPFTHHQQFERTIQTPVGSTWNTQRAFQKLTMPKVVTKPGHIIKPIKAEDVGYRSSSRSDLSVVQRNPKRLSIRHKKLLENNCVDWIAEVVTPWCREPIAPTVPPLAWFYLELQDDSKTSLAHHGCS